MKIFIIRFYGDVFYDEKVLMFFVNTIAKPHVKRLNVTLQAQMPRHGNGPRQLVTVFDVIQRV